MPFKFFFKISSIVIFCTRSWRSIKMVAILVVGCQPEAPLVFRGIKCALKFRLALLKIIAQGSSLNRIWFNYISIEAHNCECVSFLLGLYPIKTSKFHPTTVFRSTSSISCQIIDSQLVDSVNLFISIWIRWNDLTCVKVKRC